MSRLFLPVSLLGYFTLVCAAGPAHAQYLYVGSDSEQGSRAPGEATVSSMGTEVSGQYAFIAPASTSTVNYIGLDTFSSSFLTITGGSFQALLTQDSSTIDLIGSNFAESSAYSFINNQPYYTITGQLQGDTSPFTAGYNAQSTGVLEFDGAPAVPGANPVPEASTLLSFGLLLVGVAGAFARKRVGTKSGL